QHRCVRAAMSPQFVSDRLVPGSERAVENVDTKLMREIVRDLGHGPARLPSVHPDAQAPRAVGSMETPLRQPAGIEHIDRMCAAADKQDRIAKIEVLSRTIANLQAGQDAEIARLKEENAHLQAELVKAKP